jgi:hypothetical protein
VLYLKCLVTMDTTKTTASYNTGLNDKGWASSFLLSQWAGDGYVYNTAGAGTTYFFAVGYAPKDSKHSLNLSVLRRWSMAPPKRCLGFYS